MSSLDIATVCINIFPSSLLLLYLILGFQKRKGNQCSSLAQYSAFCIIPIFYSKARKRSVSSQALFGQERQRLTYCLRHRRFGASLPNMSIHTQRGMNVCPISDKHLICMQDVREAWNQGVQPCFLSYTYLWDHSKLQSTTFHIKAHCPIALRIKSTATLIPQEGSFAQSAQLSRQHITPVGRGQSGNEDKAWTETWINFISWWSTGNKRVTKSSSIHKLAVWLITVNMVIQLITDYFHLRKR